MALFPKGAVRITQELIDDGVANWTAKLRGMGLPLERIIALPDGTAFDEQTMRMFHLFLKRPWEPWHLAFLRCQLQSRYGQDASDLLSRFDDSWQQCADKARTRCRNVRQRFLKQHEGMVADAFSVIPF